MVPLTYTPKQRIDFTRGLARTVCSAIDEAGLGPSDAMMVAIEIAVATNAGQLAMLPPAEREEWLRDAMKMHAEHITNLVFETLEAYEKSKN